MNKAAAPSDSVAEVVENPTKCPHCGAITRLDHGTCINCLLREGLEAKGEASREVFESILAEANVTDNQWRLGHYEILEEIGRGGMGVIYRARQRHSRRIVAVKRILAHQVDSHETLVRFRREAEAVASLDHPNILPIHEVSESEEGLPFFSMKYATGGSLRTAASTLRSKPRECVRVMAKVARAIAYAHGKRVLHRDLQPGNILLDENGEPMVSDFGLAKWLDQTSDLTRTLETLGTPGYIAPEQTECSADKLTSAADIYSLGAILFYLLTGRPPFVGPNVLFVIHQAAATPAPRLRSLAPSLDRDLETIVAHCLESDPNARYQSAGALAEDLEHWLRHEPIRARRTGVFTHGGKWVRRNPTSMVLVTSLIALAAAIGVILWEKESARPLPPMPAGVAVLPFENLNADPKNAPFTDGVQDEILNDLTKIADLKVISRTSVMQYKSGGKRNLRQIANELGVTYVVEGSVQRFGNHVRVNAQLVDTRTDRHLWGQTYDRDLADVFTIQSEIAKTIAEQLQTKISPREKAAIEQRPTSDLVAYDRYVQAASLIDNARYAPNQEPDRNFFQAIELLNQAIARDPNFLLAYCRLAEIHDELYFESADRTPGRLALAQSAIDTAFRVRPDSGEAHLALAAHLYHGYFDYDRARDELAIAARTMPNDARIFEWSGYIDRRQGLWHDAVRNFERAMELDPRNLRILTDAANTYESMRNHGQARAIMDRVIALEPNQLAHRGRRALIDFEERADLRPMRAVLEQALAKEPASAQYLVWRFYLDLFERDPVAADNTFAALGGNTFGARNVGGMVFSRAVLEGLLARMKGDAGAAQAAFSAARIQQQQAVRARPDYGPLLCVLGLIDAALGRKEEALREGRRAIELASIAKDSLDGADVLYFYAVICAWTGEYDLAIEQLETLAKIPAGPSYGDLRLNLVWDPLRNDPRFEKLAEQAKIPIALESPRPLPAGIAVLPFENLSADPENAFFADGVQDEVLNNLAKVADLRVISRTSVMQYKSGAKRNLRQIANELGVAHVVEGSVQRAANRVRVSVQLIDARTDAHLWVNRYDRPLGDVFAIQTEIAKAIAESLQVKVTGREEQALAAKPTSNPEAYDAYLRGLALEARSSVSNDALTKAIGFYEQAVQRDPNFALGWARLSRADALLYFRLADPTPARRNAAKGALDNAQKLQPNSPEALLALGYYQYWVLGNYGLAKTTFGRVSKMLPSSSDVPEALAAVTRREGNWDESVAHWEEALALDPRNLELLMDTAMTYLMLRQFPAALRLYDRALDILPNDPDLMALKASIHQAQGNLDEAAKLSSEINAQTRSGMAFQIKINLLRLERNLDEAVQLLQARQAQFQFASEIEKGFNQVLLAFTQRLAGDTASAKVTAAQARDTLEPLSRNQPDSAFLAALLSRAYTALGDKNSALKEAERAITPLPSTKDRIEGPAGEENLALIQMTFGDNSPAISTLARLLQTPYDGWLCRPTPLTPALLRLDPTWDALRGDPRFEKLLEDSKKPVVLK